MSHVVGSGYFGSGSLLTSSGNDELIQQHKPTGFDSFCAYKFNFYNIELCTIKINDSDAIYLKANQGFSSDYYDAPIYTFEIVTKSVQYTYIGMY
jgi:hypothetical protein